MEILNETNYGDEEMTKLQILSFRNPASIFIRGILCPTVFDFYREIASAFKFPLYFGWNGMAFQEMLYYLDDWLIFDHMDWVFDDWQYVFRAYPDAEEVREPYKELFVYFAQYWIDKGIPVKIYLNSRTPDHYGQMHNVCFPLSKKYGVEEKKWMIDHLNG